jgi:site-specific DNA-methyltransferase (adenine-specific)
MHYDEQREEFETQQDITLMQGDCLERMKEIESGSVDMVLADPPYGTTACKWDSIIPLEPMWEQLKRVIKPNGAIVLMSGQPFTAILTCSNLKMYRYDWIWEKDKGANWMFGNKQPLKVHEFASVFYSKQPDYLPQKTPNPKGESKRHLSKNPCKITAHVKNIMGECWSETEMNATLNYHGKDYEPKMLLPRSIQKFSRDAKGKVHPTQKPVALMEYLIKTYTNEGETVLDFTMGSGTTGVAAKNLNRKFIGIELDEGYFNIAKDRINNTNKDQQ